MIGASLLLIALAFDGALSRLDGALLFALLAIYTVFLVVQSRRVTAATKRASAGDTNAIGEHGNIAHAGDVPLAAVRGLDSKLGGQVALIVGGLVLLALGSQLLVTAAIAIATSLGVPELVIGLTIVAAGTSLPEVSASVTAAIRGQRDIAIGNVIGSNTFNILGVLGASALVAPSPLPVPVSMLHGDMMVMLAVAVACLPIFFAGFVVTRWEGAVFFGYYVAYTLWLVLQSQQHTALGQFEFVMRSVVLPATALTLLITTSRALRVRR